MENIILNNIARSIISEGGTLHIQNLSASQLGWQKDCIGGTGYVGLHDGFAAGREFILYDVDQPRFKDYTDALIGLGVAEVVADESSRNSYGGKSGFTAFKITRNYVVSRLDIEQHILAAFRALAQPA